MAIVRRFILPDAVSAGHDIFIAGIGLFTGGVMDVPLSATVLIAHLLTTAGVLDLGVIDNAPAVAAAAVTDPDPQYMTPAEFVVSVQGGTDAVAAALKAAYLPKWKPLTAYTSVDIVLNPTGQIVQANAPFTSGATYVSGNWTILSSGGGGGSAADATNSTKGIVLLSGDFGGTADFPTVVNGTNHTHTAAQASAVPTSQKGAVNGVATLGSTGKIPLTQMPPNNWQPGDTKTILKDPTTGFWPSGWNSDGSASYTGGAIDSGVRPTSRADVFFHWQGPDPSPAVVSSGTAGMLSGIDSRFVTP